MLVATMIFTGLTGLVLGFWISCSWYKVLREEWDGK